MKCARNKAIKNSLKSYWLIVRNILSKISCHWTDNPFLSFATKASKVQWKDVALPWNRTQLSPNYINSTGLQVGLCSSLFSSFSNLIHYCCLRLFLGLLKTWTTRKKGSSAIVVGMFLPRSRKSCLCPKQFFKMSLVNAGSSRGVFRVHFSTLRTTKTTSTTSSVPA